MEMSLRLQKKGPTKKSRETEKQEENLSEVANDAFSLDSLLPHALSESQCVALSLYCLLQHFAFVIKFLRNALSNSILCILVSLTITLLSYVHSDTRMKTMKV